MAATARARRSDLGASSMELALLTPILILVILSVVQFTMIFHARHVALAAAQSGARVARSEPGGSWRAEARERAVRSVRGYGSRLLSDLRVVTDADADDNRWVEVSGTAVRVVPFLSSRALQVRQRAGGPVECFRPDDGDIDCE
ncbi:MULTISPECIES: TadE/TadG family type IV pilus assembly protein [Thermomonospora]|uniref:TadE family protein n=1 Tax=Thermomonospora curvata (strain ATCC 19995 / DSM 43183 / JCM 3096 / KCTC 9072 / NBRC 15933 / NCIMB 10081 / Henssen B9) TaxID=471852 RepID=D1A213_THECD|nr:MULTISPECIES: TadE family protein [Thermomonospora]ACY99666.1 TadE family protein [Thermomonospora curvata DSM 43183]PKK12687.1 MAG: TadE family protein [Thermomonospora sp. CIF 1]